jgi:phospholipid/cholesterol/gamma-HCH transport system substrate-binding protein
METKANYVLIGFFTLGVLAGGFAFVHWFRSIGKSTVSANYHVVFQGPVGGLRTGASVLFNGMRVGEVSDLQLNRHDPKQVIATVKIDANTPVRSDTVVGLDFQGLTGIANIALKGGDPAAGPLPEGSDGMAVLTAEVGATQDISAAVREVLRKIDVFITDNSSQVHNSLVNIEAFTDTLKKNSERIDTIMAKIDSAATGADSAMKSADAFFKKTDGVMKGIEKLTGNGDDDKPGEIAETLRSYKVLAEDLDKKTLKNFDALLADGRRTLATIDVAVRNFDRNPQRIIFGGGQPATPAPAAPAQPQQRRAQ